MGHEGQRESFLRQELHCKRARAERDEITSRVEHMRCRGRLDFLGKTEGRTRRRGCRGVGCGYSFGRVHRVHPG